MREAPRAILLDIEGTTSSTAFVSEVLFPYARAHLRAFVAANREATAPVLAQIPGDPVETLLRWMDEDRKQTALKALQGMIWADGYASGELQGHVYPDTPDALCRWQARGVPAFIYSSGSIEAQKLIFSHSVAGDLTPLLSGYFDTRTGGKRDAGSYSAIAAATGLVASDILFVSDVQAEVDAARAAGMKALLIDREGGDGEVSSLGEVLP
jgi:enolase-phosphatase E1